MEQAHETCGWFRADEGDPVERIKPGSFMRYWEWRCPDCGLDACGRAAPTDEWRCGRCRMPVVGEKARFIQIVMMRNVRIPIGMTCTVRETLPDGWGVSFGGSPDVHRVPFGSIVRVESPKAPEVTPMK